MYNMVQIPISETKMDVLHFMFPHVTEIWELQELYRPANFTLIPVISPDILLFTTRYGGDIERYLSFY